MPYSPPGSHNCHASYHNIGRENIRIEQQHQTQTGILNTSLYGYCSPVVRCSSCNGRKGKAGEKSQQVVDQHDEEYDLDKLKEKIIITPKKNYHHSKEHNYR